MEEDFHFYCIAVLAKAAGYSAGDAKKIAYASQYVDNSTESEPIKIGQMIFDPVRTAHNGLKAFDWGVQKKVYFPFHFIPPRPIRQPEDPFITEPNSVFAQMILQEARNEQQEDFRLYRIGVALHTFADTWSHQGFSGREDEINDVEKIYHYKNDKWKRLLFQNIYLDFLPKIGHGQAGHYPDWPFLKWKYKRDATNKIVSHDNTTKFLEAAKAVYDFLITVPKSVSIPVTRWGNLEGSIHELLSNNEEDLGRRCGAWEVRYGNWFENVGLDYDRMEWRREALRSDEIAWDDDDPSDFRKRHYNLHPEFYRSSWVMFHRAALLQRHFVLENLL